MLRDAGLSRERAIQMARDIVQVGRDALGLSQPDWEGFQDQDHISNEILDYADEQAMRETDRLIQENDNLIRNFDQEEAREMAEPTPQRARGENDGDVAAAAARVSSGGGPNMPSKETPISNYPSLTYGFQETHTTILPWTGWIMASKLDTAQPVQLVVRMNTPVDMVPISTIATPSLPATPSTKGFYTTPSAEDGTFSNLGFPETMGSPSTSTTERPSWRETWFRMYEYYTVLKCHYQITVLNPMERRGYNMQIGEQFDSYSDTNGATGNRMPETNLSEALSYKNIKWHKAHPDRGEDAGGNNVVVIEGTWWPGKIKRNIINDGDVKTWTKTYDGGSPALPNMQELLTVNLWRAGLSYDKNTSTIPMNANIEIRLKYIVQFKDLQQQIRYPNTVSETGSVQLNFGTGPTGSGNPLARW